MAVYALLPLVLPAIRAQIQTLEMHSTSHLHPSMERRRAQISEPQGNNSAVYASLEPLLSMLTEEEQEEFEASRVLSRHEHALRNRRRRAQEEGMEGGKLNVYQPAPLLQGYGTHYATVWVGTPPQRKSVIVDTGSHYTAFPCSGCQNCGEENHTDEFFDPAKSKTFRSLTCAECQQSSCHGNLCTFSQSYTEGSSWQAFQALDRFFVGRNQMDGMDDPVDTSFAIDYMFGCQTSETGLFVTQLADGIMGMSAHDATLAKQMYDEKKIEHNMFTLCFRRELTVSKEGVTAGIMTLGGIDTRLHDTPMVYANNVVKNGWFTVYVNNIYLKVGGGKSAKVDHKKTKIVRLPIDVTEMNSGKGVIVDSGTTDTYLHTSLGDGFNDAWIGVTGTPYSNSAIRLTQDQLISLPTILIQMTSYEKDFKGVGNPRHIVGFAGDLDPRRPYDIIVAIPGTHYMEYSPSKDVYTSRVYFTEGRGGVIGANAMQGHDILFDWENGRVGFAESSCQYTSLFSNENKENVDCTVSRPSLAGTCAQGINDPIGQCQDHGPLKILGGTSKYVWVVEKMGTGNGRTCNDVVIKSAWENNIITTQYDGKVNVDCDVSGLCYLVLACEVSCKDALSAPLAPVEQGNVLCGDNQWSACTPSCIQSKVKSVSMEDGKCYDVESSFESRECHVEDCARDDPCRIPFVVHAVLGLAGVDAALWDKQVEELFVSTLATITDRQMGKLSFRPGDVRVLMTSPWEDTESSLPNDGSPPPKGAAKDIIGVKVIFEISLFNPTAILPPPPNQEDTIIPSTKIGLSSVLEKINFISAPNALPKAVCKEEDLYPFAQLALSIHTILSQPEFIPELIRSLQSNPYPDKEFLFSDLGNPMHAAISKLISSWTIKTEVAGRGKLHNHERDHHMLRKKFGWDNLPGDYLAAFFVVFALLVVWFGFGSVKARTGALWAAARDRVRESRKGAYAPVATELELL